MLGVDGHRTDYSSVLRCAPVDGLPVLVATSYPYGLVSARAAPLRDQFIPVMILGLGVLALIQIPLALRLARRLSNEEPSVGSCSSR